MSTITASVDIERPVGEVFEHATCLRSCVRWMTSMSGAEKISDGNVGVGTRYRHKIKFMGIEVETRPAVRRYEPPFDLAFGDEEAMVPYETRFHFEEIPGGTRFTVTSESEPKGLINGIARPLLDKAFSRQMQNDLFSLKEMLEAGVQVKMP